MSKKIAVIYQAETEDNLRQELGCFVSNARNNGDTQVHYRYGGTTFVITAESSVDVLLQEYQLAHAGFHPTPDRIGPTKSAGVFG